MELDFSFKNYLQHNCPQSVTHPTMLNFNLYKNTPTGWGWSHTNSAWQQIWSQSVRLEEAAEMKSDLQVRVTVGGNGQVDFS